MVPHLRKTRVATAALSVWRGLQAPPGQPRLFPLPPQAPSSWSTRRNAPTWCALSWRSTRRCVDCRDVGVEGIVVDESMAADTSWRICRVDIHLTNGRGKRSTHSINIPLSALSRGGNQGRDLVRSNFGTVRANLPISIVHARDTQSRPAPSRWPRSISRSG